MIRRLIVAAAIITTTAFAGCSGSQPPIGARDALPGIEWSSSDGYSIVHSFGGVGDGQQPKAALINVKGVLYGTTYAGGASGDGTVFSVAPSGSEEVLYSFRAYSAGDGANPSAALLAFKGALFGTTEYGGTPTTDSGTVFSVDPDGSKEKVVYAFGVPPDGQFPVASLIDIKGRLYGTTSGGGSYSYCFKHCGAIFVVDKNGHEKVLHSFMEYSDGSIPVAPLLKFKATLYGTTEAGASSGSYGAGSIYSVSMAGKEHALLAFPAGGYEGAAPLAGLISIKGALYGTTGYGGAYGNDGTAFKVTTGGSLTTLHSFGYSQDGSRPAAALLDVKGTLYGTTSAGGKYGKGTIFKMSLTGKETVLHSFGFGFDGATPLAGLIDVKGTLYGTTSAGGTQGYGTVFALRIK